MIKNIVLLLGLSLITTYTYLDNKLLGISKYKIVNNKIPREFNNYKIIHLSDFHNYKYIGDNNSTIIDKIDNEKPNIIVITGDMVNKYDKKFDNFFSLVEALSGKYEMYYIVGNHEKRLNCYYLNMIMTKLKNLNVKVINNQKITLARKHACINLYGLDIPLSFYKTKNRPLNIEEIVSAELIKCKGKEYNILLVHNPLYFDFYAKYNIDLTLAGHVHGGMIRIPFIGGLLSPERKFFPKYNSGIYDIDNKKLIVSRGMGHSSPGIRIFNMPEIVSITLQN